MRKMKSEVLRRAARHSMEAHALYTADFYLRVAADELEGVGESAFATELRIKADDLARRRRRLMRQPGRTDASEHVAEKPSATVPAK